ncbi:hypothetical protein C6P45_002399 [Maudiozyma exigua]|uniref:CBM21 domain-containing protein n=1 Tax=Maudiozyma exigua TaxID=34358 RepID=A0A9P7B3H5_MAUEX|nr:hypothetical protein C6P45_002399 [Kazachstania exigua]
MIDIKDFEDNNTQLLSTSSLSPQSSLPILKPKIYKKLKSSLKLSSSRNNSLTSTISNSSIHSSLSCTSSSSSSSHKSVRFAPELTTVKKFCSTDKPSFISSTTLENKKYSNYLIPLDENLNSSNNNNTIDFNDRIINSQFLPSFNNNSNNNNNFQLDYDSDSSIDDDDFSYNLNQRLDLINDTDSNNQYQNNIIIDNSDTKRTTTTTAVTNSLDSFDVLDWNLIGTNLNSTNTIDSMNNQNIKLHSIEQIKDSNNKKTDEIIGTIYVSNLTFEKFIEIKFTFTNWSDIHYITATYNKSINDKIDEFKFIVNLSSFKYFLKLENLLFSNTQSNLPTNCPLKIEFCCRYDVNNETYYDNNNYSNYELSVIARTMNLIPNENFNPIYKTKEHHNINNNKKVNQKPIKKSFYSDFLVSTTLSHKIHLLNNFKSTNQKKIKQPTITRRFSEDTDYYNTSPLKHLYHNDTTPIRPTSLNRVLTPSNEQTTEFTNKDNTNNNNTLGYPSSNPYDCSDDVAQLSSFQSFQYAATPSLSSSLSSSLTDLPQLDDYTYFLTNENDDLPQDLEQFQYNPNYNFADSFTKSFNQLGSDSDGTEVPTNFNNDNNSNNNETINNDILNENDEYIDPLHNSNFNDDTRSIITDRPQNTFNNFNNHNLSRYVTPENIIFQNNNNSNETLINHKLMPLSRQQQQIDDTLTPITVIPQISAIRSNTVDEPSPPSSTSSESSSNPSSFLSASNELDNRGQAI